MREIYETYVDLLDVRFRSNTLVVLLISLCIIAVWWLSPKNSNLVYEDSHNSQISYYNK